MTCWLAMVGYIEGYDPSGAAVGCPVKGWSKCHGPIDSCHLIPKQLLRREFPCGAFRSLGSDIWRPISTTADIAAIDSVRDLYELTHDPRITVDGCRQHHHMFDVSRNLRIPRESLPTGVEEFAYELGLSWWLEREYGKREKAA